MKQVYYFLLLAVLALSSATAKADTSVKIKVDDAARVTVKVNYAPVAVVTGTNTVNVPQYGSVQIEARQGFYLKSVTKKGTQGDATQQTISGLTSCSLYISESDRNAMFTVKSGDLEAARTGSCTVTVDHAAKVKMMRYESQTAVDLTDGDNTVKWIPGTEKTLVISNRNYGEAPIYKVAVDGQDVVTSDGQYFVVPRQGSTIVITAGYPDTDCPVTFQFNDASAKGVLSGVTVDGTAVSNFLEAGFTVKAGSKLSLKFDKTNYSLDAFKVNGTPVTVYGTYECYVREATAFDIQAHRYATVKATLTVDKAANITAYEGQSYDNKVITLHDGENTLELSEKNNLVQLKPNSGCRIESVKADGTAQSADYDGAYNIRLTEGMKIDITTSAVVRDQKATVVIDDISLAGYGFNFYRSDHSTVPMQTGENTVMFSADDHHFLLAAYGNDLGKMEVKLNGTKLAPSYPGGTSFEFDLKNNDRLEVFLKGAPTGIGTIGQARGGEAAVYRLDGTRVQGTGLSKGIYIINGKKTAINKR
ncbi:hypothetical protein J4864_08875 [Prevotella multiformis]|uniref:hypothetical protein n=1 Tax=Prevotella multiformis TaxID=282402 RepID=UPI001BA749DE|nr:hypothetical protein [Prevotella multiformis]QUB72223.1 hypothetical protein J4864_08875 [Prevotella multiformis]